MVSAQISASSEWGSREETKVRASLRPRIVHNDWRTSRIKIRPLDLAGMSGVQVCEDVERQTTGKGSDAGKLPTFQNPAGDPFGEALLTSAHRYLPTVVEYQALSHIEIRIPALRLQVERIARELFIARRGHQGVRSIVNGVRPGIRGLERQPLEEPFCHIRLQRVIDRRSAVGVQFRMQKRVVVHGVKGQQPRFGAEPEIVELQSGLITLP